MRSATSGPATTSCSGRPTATPVIISGHPAEKGHVRPVPQGVRRPRARRRPALRRRAEPHRQRRRAARGPPRRGRRDPRLADVRGAMPARVGLAVGRAAQRARPRRHRLGRASAGRSPRCPTAPAARSASPTRRGTSATPRSACAAAPSTAARTTATVLADVLGYDDATIDGLEADGVLSSRVPSSRAMTPALARSSPMRATLGQLPTEDDGWAYEIKWDGYRTLAFVEGGKVRLQSSNSIDVTARYPELQPLAAELRRAAGDPRRRARRARRARAAAVRADPAQGDGPPRGGLLRVRRAGHRPPRHRSACPTRSAAACCASCSTTGPTGRSRPTASATAGPCSTPRSPRSWRA